MLPIQIFSIALMPLQRQNTFKVIQSTVGEADTHLAGHKNFKRFCGTFKLLQNRCTASIRMTLKVPDINEFNRNILSRHNSAVLNTFLCDHAAVILMQILGYNPSFLMRWSVSTKHKTSEHTVENWTWLPQSMIKFGHIAFLFIHSLTESDQW